jgi:hypothetical protein
VPRPVPFITAGLVLVVSTAVGSLFVLHQRDTRADLRARHQLDTATFVVDAVGVASSHRVAVVLNVSSAVPFEVVDASVTGDGWQVTHGRAIGLRLDVDCLGTARPPEAAAAVVELHGQHRSVDLLADPAVFDVVRTTGREACGDLDAGKAVMGRATATTKAGAQLSFDLTVSNRSVHAVQVRGFALGGVRIATAQKLPFPVAPHSTRKVHLVLTLASCTVTPATELTLRVDGKGGPGALQVSSRRLPELVGALKRERCR